jgi:DNA-binding protein H-NS
MQQVLTQETMNNMTLADLRELAKDIEREFAARELRKRGEAVALVREIAAEAGLTVDELFALFKSSKMLRLPSQKSPAQKAKARYRNPADDREWTGRGKMPKWVREALDAGREAEITIR